MGYAQRRIIPQASGRRTGPSEARSRLTRHMKKPGSRRASSRTSNGSVELVDDLARGRLDEVHVIVRIDVAILRHRRTPVARHRAELHVSRKPRSDPELLAHRDRSNPPPGHIFSD